MVDKLAVDMRRKEVFVEVATRFDRDDEAFLERDAEAEVLEKGFGRTTFGEAADVVHVEAEEVTCRARARGYVSWRKAGQEEEKGAQEEDVPTPWG